LLMNVHPCPLAEIPSPLQPTITMLAMVEPLAPSLKWPVGMSPESVRLKHGQ